MSNEHHILGPPGTGKTTTVAKNVAKAVEKFGPTGPLVCSFTKAAATELTNREVPLDPSRIGTLHSICYRAIGLPEIAEAHISQWNEDFPGMKMTGEKSNTVDDATPDQFLSTDGQLSQYNLLRAKLTPEELYPVSIQSFVKRWEEWKESNNYVDFSDMIRIGRENFDAPPGHPDVMFVDEAQDLNAAQFDCVRHWSKDLDRLVFVGDDDQAIYKFTGADARNLIDRDIPEKNRIVLKKSYRLPKAVHAASQKWIERCNHRQEKQFEPDGREGGVEVFYRGNWRNPEGILDHAIKTSDEGKTVMILATCSYMLKPSIDFLKSEGIIFHNPYRTTRGDWNPYVSKKGSTLQRIVQFRRGNEDGFSPGWSYANMLAWSDLFPSKGIFKRGAKTWLQKYGTDTEKMHTIVPFEQYKNFLEEGPWSSFEPWDGQDLLSYIKENVVTRRYDQVNYICKTIERNGKVSILDVPKVTIGTIHSVKGAEADVVYLFPDMSRDATAEWDRGGDAQDAMRRTFYVGMTRAREKLIVAPPASDLAVRLA